MPRAYYNDNNRAAVAVLKQLISDGVIAPGDVDDRSIKDVQPNDLVGYTQVHCFAGGGLWSVAARMAGWPDTRPIWTGSCPCQPFSSAGSGLGTDDPRHLWPDFYRLIRAGRPAVVMGEQVARKAGYGWLDGVRADLAAEGYASRAVDIPACAVDAPHERNRLYWIAVADAARLGWREGRPEHELRGRRNTPADANGEGSMAAPACYGQQVSLGGRHAAIEEPIRPGPPFRNGSWWADADWIECHDGKARRAQSGAPLLVDGLLGRVDLWRLAGNAISPVLAAEVIAAFMEADPPATAAPGTEG